MHIPQQVYLVNGFTDMRKSINGLSILVSDTLAMDPLSQAWFVFCNKQRDKLKILFWDTNGFWLYYRRLEQGRFRWPNQLIAQSSMGIEQRQLQWLLSGLPITNNTRHPPLARGICDVIYHDHFCPLERSCQCVML
jgi:transposase